MSTMSRTLFRLTFAAALAGSASVAVADPEAGADLLDVSCGNFLGMLATANPGTNPTPERSADAADAQQNAFKAMIWAHGYTSGKHGIDQKATPLNKAWIVKTVPLLVAECRKNSKASFYSAVQAVDGK